MATSDTSHSTEVLFEGKEPLVRDLYRHLLTEIRKVGPFREKPREKSVQLGNRTAFAAVYIRSSSIQLIIRTDYKINSPRIEDIEQAAENRYHHSIRLTSKKAVDEELMQWLTDAYRLST